MRIVLLTLTGLFFCWHSTAHLLASSNSRVLKQDESKEQGPTKSQANKNDDSPKKIPTIDEKTTGMIRQDGFVPFYWDEKAGKIWIEIKNFGDDFLYVHSLATGLGSNPVGLDRGQLGDQKVVQFRRVGPKILLIQRNLRFRANTENQPERKAVEQSFAQSIIWGGTVGAEQDGRVLLDITSLLMTDMQGVIEKLARTGQGDFKLDINRSAVYLPRCKSFPANTEFEATLTFSGKKPGRFVRQTTPTPNSISLRQHHSFVKLPDENYQPRAYDVRCPSMHITFADYATPIDSQLQKRWILRHRLIKKNPAAAFSEPVEPIVYYVDAGAPRQIKDALVDGASWWNQAYEAAGFKNAFQVKMMPADADPLDVRYNIIQWVHRSTRGWSYGGSVIDPRTGEIIKGHVTLGSLRVRQDRLLFEGLGGSVPQAAAPPSGLSSCGVAGVAEESFLASFGKNDPVEVALARIRQLSAHEVGHTLGFVHNFAASTYGDRASVMDYPAPRIKITADEKLDFSDAYGVGIGAWDKIAVRYAYTQFADGTDEKTELDKILQEAADKKMVFISDGDSRPASASHPYAHLWDNGSDPITELRHVLQVRQIALKNFEPQKLPDGTTTAEIEQYLVPVFLHHRYQIQAVGKMLGGVNYQYGYAANPPAKTTLTRQQQDDAVAMLLECIADHQLTLDKKILNAISPQPRNSIRSQEKFSAKTGRNFDQYQPAKIAINLVLSELLQVERLNRLAEAKDPTIFARLRQIKKKVATYDPMRTQQELRISRMKTLALVEKLMEVVDHPNASVDTSSAALSVLAGFGRNVPSENWNSTANDSEKITEYLAFQLKVKRMVERFLNRPHAVAPKVETPQIPPGSPIGGGR